MEIKDLYNLDETIAKKYLDGEDIEDFIAVDLELISK